MEKVDIVDSNNIVTGVETREVAHEKGLLHRCIIAELKNEKSEWIFVKQSSRMQDKGQFASAAGGHIVSGETEIEALKREVMEELGIKRFTFLKKGNAIFEREINGHIENHLFIVYEISSKDEIRLNDESVEYQKLTTTDIKSTLREDPNKFGAALIFIFENLYPEVLQ